MIPLLLLFLKTLAVFAASGLVLLFQRRASASARHLVCLLTLVSLLALPLFSLTLPGWRLPVLRQEPIQTFQRQEPTLQEPTQAQAPTLPKREGEELSPLVTYSSSSHFRRTHARKLVSAQGGGFLILYTLGVLLAALRPLLGLRGISYLRRACVPVTDPATLAQSDQCAAVLHLKRRPLLCVADVPVPMTWGWRRPVVLLPLEAIHWMEDRTQAVLLHEMAHIKRRDWLSHRLADFVCAVYWFHPLVWLTARRLRAEGEIACDDLVLASGIAAPDYARHLLDIARALPPSSRPTQSAIAMAQTSQIEGRLTMILDKTLSRRTITRRVLLTALIFGAVVVVPLAMLKPTAKAQTMSAAPVLPVTAPEPQALAIDTTPTGQPAALPIELVGLTDSKEKGGKWWSASGVPLSQSPFYNLAAHPMTVVGFTTERTVLFALRLPPNAQNVTAVLTAPNSDTSSSPGQWPGKMQGQESITEATLNRETGGVRTLEAMYPPSAARGTLRAGIASGPWKVAALCTFNADGQTGNIGIHQNGKSYLFSPTTVMGNHTTLSIATDATDDIRVVAVNAQGQEFLPAEIDGNSIDKLNQITVRFNLLPSQIKEIHVETRPFTWTEFKDIALHPA